VSCGAVLQSAYGTAFGVPVAAGGAIWAGLVLLLAVAGMGGSDRERVETTVGYVFVLSVVGLAAVFYFGYASFFVLQKMCVLCVAMYISVIGIFLTSSGATSVALSALPGRLFRDLRAVFMRPAAASLAILWLAGSVSLIAFFPREEPYVESSAQATAAPLEALDAAQLTEWHAWLDRQPREADVAPGKPGTVLLLKFNDYQCPSCRATWIAYRDIVARYEAQYPGVFSFETRDFPLENECGFGGIHGGACEAAVAARLAKVKGRGPEMEAWLYEHQNELTRSSVKQAAQEVAGVEDFDEQYDTVLAKVREDAQLGNRLGVSGTPTFYLNGIKMPSVRPAHFDAAIAYEIQKARGLP
jgi:protein-disulfide isomerase